ncbi:DAK2 domain-containing protein [Janibacter sp. DB-40]|uniref:DAK2 domain-containing protein n=1 Tax=Janibacter sp. DB-40 TaxID=3028808 RepID=UPI002406B93B|nr:DAK2 domain-containing protein [Janibacter sp. DB-40]
MLEVMDAESVRRWVVVTRAALAARRAEIDALNVFPVPDGDTGTNMYLTLDQALHATRTEQERLGEEGSPRLDAEVAAMSRAALMSARGNSGVILSQLVRGVSDVIAGEHLTVVDAPAVARAIAQGARRARESVVRPQEGTILTVADATAAAAEQAAREGGSLGELTVAAVTAAREALARTPEQLQVLADAGVVDAGGAGYLLFIEALDRVVHDKGPAQHFAVDDFTLNTTLERRADWSHDGGDRAPAVGYDRDGHDGPAYEVMYLLREVPEEGVLVLRRELDGLGDSVVVSGAEDLTHVHVHTDDIGGVLQAGLAHGAPDRVVVTLLDTTPATPQRGVSLVACAAGPGIAEVITQAGAVSVPSGPGHRASAGELVAAVREGGTEEVILLPNDRDTRMAADVAAQAAAQEGRTVHVIGSTTAVQGLAALAVFDPGLTVTQNVLAMTRTAAATRHGGVTVAVKSGLTSGGACEIGDVLGVVAGDITIVGSDMDEVAREVLDTITGTGAELVTVVVGEDAPDGLVERLTARVESQRVEVEVIDGGQPHYPLLFGVE